MHLERKTSNRSSAPICRVNTTVPQLPRQQPLPRGLPHLANMWIRRRKLLVHTADHVGVKSIRHTALKCFASWILASCLCRQSLASHCNNSRFWIQVALADCSGSSVCSCRWSRVAAMAEPAVSTLEQEQRASETSHLLVRFRHTRDLRCNPWTETQWDVWSKGRI